MMYRKRVCFKCNGYFRYLLLFWSAEPEKVKIGKTKMCHSLDLSTVHIMSLSINGVRWPFSTLAMRRAKFNWLRSEKERAADTGFHQTKPQETPTVFNSLRLSVCLCLSVPLSLTSEATDNQSRFKLQFDSIVKSEPFNRNPAPIKHRPLALACSQCQSKESLEQWFSTRRPRTKGGPRQGALWTFKVWYSADSSTRTQRRVYVC